MQMLLLTFQVTFSKCRTCMVALVLLWLQIKTKQVWMAPSTWTITSLLINNSSHLESHTSRNNLFKISTTPWLCQFPQSLLSLGKLRRSVRPSPKEGKLGDRRSPCQKSKRIHSILVACRMTIPALTTNWVRASTTVEKEITQDLGRGFKFNGHPLQLTSKKKTNMRGRAVLSSMRGLITLVLRCLPWTI